MEQAKYNEMSEKLNSLIEDGRLSGKRILLFGHCNATEELADLLMSRGFTVEAILDNNASKHGMSYKDIPVIFPAEFVDGQTDDSIVFIVTRFYEAMNRQLRELGFDGDVIKLVDYNTYADYSLSDETVNRMKTRVHHGEELTGCLNDMYDHPFKVFCPFNALGDIYIMMSYWESYASKRGIKKPVFCVLGKVLSGIIRMFGDYSVEVYPQRDLDSMIQYAIYSQDETSFIAHQDRPYVVDLHKALSFKRITLEEMYCCGVFGLPRDTVPSVPAYGLKEYDGNIEIPKGKSVVFSPYAKSVTAIDEQIWEDAVLHYSNLGYKCFTNVVGDEKPINGSEPLDVPLAEMVSVLEKAGCFIGIRSGLCDVIRSAKCKKIALYPDYNYSDTKWKAIDIYSIEGFDNIALEAGDTWETIKAKIQ
ncbi:MAG: hypothetical protein K5871_07590 [Lachnospiraceae bacterium]|nr:hypothetical protein [Lachnospiraceae bacterium]